jgi:Ca-activated chloride channel family protein
MSSIEFANIEFLVGLLILPLAIVWYVLKFKQQKPTVGISTFRSFNLTSSSLKPKLRHSLFSLKIIGLGLLIVALARPQSSTSWQDVTTEGIDIVIALDISSSMLARDFEPNRLEASKQVAIDFIAERPNDRMGLVIYSGESFTQCPITTDHAVLKNLFQDIKNGMIEDGTAIGLGLANAVTRIKDSEAKSKVIILLTDGENNAGTIPPLTAAEIAKSFGIRVYTIGVGTNGMAPYPVQNPFGGISYQDMEVKIDEQTLLSIAQMTDGQYFRATDKKKLKEIYQEIDKLEKSKINVTEYRKKSEEFYPWALAAFILFGLEFVLRNTYFKSAI